MAIRVETMLLRTAFICANVLLFGMLADRKTEIEGNATPIDAAGYNIAATFSGVMALGGLAVAFWTYPVWSPRRVIRTILGTVRAILSPRTPRSGSSRSSC